MCEKKTCNKHVKTCVINDPLGQTHSPTNSDHYFHTTFVLFCDFLKNREGRTEVNMNESNYHYRPSGSIFNHEGL